MLSKHTLHITGAEQTRLQNEEQQLLRPTDSWSFWDTLARATQPDLAEQVVPVGGNGRYRVL